MKEIIVALGIFVLALSVVPAYAQSTLALQEKCAEGAKKPMEDEKNIATTYTSHYNKKLDKCFIHVRYEHPFWLDILSNVFDGTMIGECVYMGKEKQECYVGNTKCKSIEEFEHLIRSYMEE